MKLEFVVKPNHNIDWLLCETRDGYNARWYIYKEVHWHGIMARVDWRNGHTDEPLPAWMIVA